MNTPLRAVLAALTGATMLLLASCTSSPESAPTTSASVTASAWVKPLESGSGSIPTSSETPAGGTSLESSFAESPPPVSDSQGQDPYFLAAPLPAGLAPQDQRQAQQALDAYGRFWKLSNDLGADPNGEWSTRIAEVATGTAAAGLQTSAAEFRDKGFRVIGQGAVVVTVKRVEPGAVELSLCVDGSAGRLVDASGAPVDRDADITTRRSGFARIGEYVSGWKVDTNYYDMGSSC